MSQGPTDRRDRRDRGAGLNDPLGTTRQGGGHNRTIRSILAGSKGAGSATAGAVSPVTVPRPVPWSTGLLGVPFVRSLPYPGVWLVWTAAYVVLGSGGQQGLKAAATLDFDPVLELVGGEAYDTWNAFDLLVHGTLEYSQVKQFTTPAISQLAVDITDPDHLDVTCDLAITDNDGTRLSDGIIQVDLRGICLTGDPNA